MSRPLSQQVPNIIVDGQVYLDVADAFDKRGDGVIYTPEEAQRDARKYENDVIDLVANAIGGAATGKALLKAIGLTKPRTMRIQPQDEVDPKAPDPDLQYRLKTATARAIRPGSSPPFQVSCGFGQADAVIRFTPEMESPDDPFATTGPGMSAAEVLLHEMVHGLRDMSNNVVTCKKDDHLPDYDNFEEFVAVLVANIYSSEKGQPLRFGHGSFAMAPRRFSMSLRSDLQDPKKYLKQTTTDGSGATVTYGDLVQQFIDEQTAFARDLGQIRTNYNPVRERMVQTGVLPP